jgi:hypothetical protein
MCDLWIESSRAKPHRCLSHIRVTAARDGEVRIARCRIGHRKATTSCAEGERGRGCSTPRQES